MSGHPSKTPYHPITVGVAVFFMAGILPTRGQAEGMVVQGGRGDCREIVNKLLTNPERKMERLKSDEPFDNIRRESTSSIKDPKQNILVRRVMQTSRLQGGALTIIIKTYNADIGKDGKPGVERLVEQMDYAFTEYHDSKCSLNALAWKNEKMENPQSITMDECAREMGIAKSDSERRTNQQAGKMSTKADLRKNFDSAFDQMSDQEQLGGDKLLPSFIGRYCEEVFAYFPPPSDSQMQTQGIERPGVRYPSNAAPVRKSDGTW